MKMELSLNEISLEDIAYNLYKNSKLNETIKVLKEKGILDTVGAKEIIERTGISRELEGIIDKLEIDTNAVELLEFIKQQYSQIKAKIYEIREGNRYTIEEGKNTNLTSQQFFKVIDAINNFPELRDDVIKFITSGTEILEEEKQQIKSVISNTGIDQNVDIDKLLKILRENERDAIKGFRMSKVLHEKEDKDEDKDNKVTNSKIEGLEAKIDELLKKANEEKDIKKLARISIKIRMLRARIDKEIEIQNIAEKYETDRKNLTEKRENERQNEGRENNEREETINSLREFIGDNIKYNPNSEYFKYKYSMDKYGLDKVIKDLKSSKNELKQMEAIKIEEVIEKMEDLEYLIAEDKDADKVSEQNEKSYQKQIKNLHSKEKKMIIAKKLNVFNRIGAFFKNIIEQIIQNRAIKKYEKLQIMESSKDYDNIDEKYNQKIEKANKELGRKKKEINEKVESETTEEKENANKAKRIADEKRKQADSKKSEVEKLEEMLKKARQEALEADKEAKSAEKENQRANTILENVQKEATKRAERNAESEYDRATQEAETEANLSEEEVNKKIKEKTVNEFKRRMMKLANNGYTPDDSKNNNAEKNEKENERI